MFFVNSLNNLKWVYIWSTVESVLQNDTLADNPHLSLSSFFYVEFPFKTMGRKTSINSL